MLKSKVYCLGEQLYNHISLILWTKYDRPAMDTCPAEIQPMMMIKTAYSLKYFHTLFHKYVVCYIKYFINIQVKIIFFFKYCFVGDCKCSPSLLLQYLYYSISKCNISYNPSNLVTSSKFSFLRSNRKTHKGIAQIFPLDISHQAS